MAAQTRLTPTGFQPDRRTLLRFVLAVIGGGLGAQAAPEAPNLPTTGEPEASIVIPVHDHWDLTAGCLRSLAEDRTPVGYEVIVVDDASVGDTPARLAALRGVRTVRLARNLGFLAAANAGLSVARGEFAVLLNNDTVVRPGWLEALVRTARAHPEAAVVGAKLVHPDGRLQEAGCIVWREGSGYQYGLGEDPDDLRFNFVRDVDYCSGAALLVRRSLLEELGGLDTRFQPAYYEDTDLCFVTRERGQRVLYQPAATVVHLEGGSHGRDPTSGVKRQQVVNRHTFCAKWAETLAGHPEPSPAVRLAAWRPPAGRVLVVDHKVPTPDQDSGSVRLVGLMTLLGNLGFGVTFCPEDSQLTAPYTAQLQELGIEVLGGPGDLTAYVSEVAPSLRLAVMCRPPVAWAHYPLLRALAPDARAVFDTVDLHFVRERRRAALEGTAEAWGSARRHLEQELTLARLYDATWVVTDSEAELLLAEDPTIAPRVVPNIHPDQPAGPPFELRRGLLFVGGMAHPANPDAIAYLVSEILPRIHRQLPGVTLTVVGSQPSEEMRALAGEHVRIVGWLPDLAEVYRRARLFVAPLRFGAGMKGKVGESLSYGLPVVTSSIGAEGMHLVDDEEVLVADDPDTFAAAVVRAYRDDLMWERLSVQGRRAVSQHYSPAAAQDNLRRVLADLSLLPGPT